MVYKKTKKQKFKFNKKKKSFKTRKKGGRFKTKFTKKRGGGWIGDWYDRTFKKKPTTQNIPTPQNNSSQPNKSIFSRFKDTFKSSSSPQNTSLPTDPGLISTLLAVNNLSESQKINIYSKNRYLLK